MSEGLKNKYCVSKRDGSQVHPNAEYFVLRLDNFQKDNNHREACIKAVLTYADAIAPFLPKLSADLKKRYSLPNYTGGDFDNDPPIGFGDSYQSHI